MHDGGYAWRLDVLAGGDALRAERLTRALHETLTETEGVTAGFVTDIDTGTAEAAWKGGAAGDVALWAAVGAAARPAAQVMISLIKEWCAKERHRKVQVTCGEDSVTITGRADGTQERMVRMFLEKVRENDGNQQGDEAE